VTEGNQVIKARLKKVIGTIMCGIVVLTTISVLFLWLHAKSVQLQATDTRQALRGLGFKTDLADFDVTNDAETRIHEGELMVFDTNPFGKKSIESLDLLPANSNGAVPAIWKQELLQTSSDPIRWEDVRETVVPKREALNTACEVVLSYPIQLELDASKGCGSFISHISSLSHLDSALNVRTLLELHEGHPAAAWTNLLAATRLATAWEPNAAADYHLFRNEFVTYAFATTWQALQYNDWPDAELARLQVEWESADLLAGVPDTAAFDCAQSVEDGRGWARQPLCDGLSFWELARSTTRDPSSGYSEIKNSFELIRFRNFGVFVDEKNLLLEMTNRENQLRQAIQSPSWADMSALPGVNISEAFQSGYDAAGDNINFHREPAQEVLARVVPGEARRRLLIVAIALERYRGKHGNYPAMLTSLVPEFLKTVPADFMDGKPLRYHLTDDGHFVLYSVGPDCVDNGGRMQSLIARGLPFGTAEFWYPQKNVDIVWPRPATAPQQNVVGK
jgi:hypothetical protein